MRISEPVSSAPTIKATPGRLKLPTAISALASLWLWFGYVSSVKQKSVRLRQQIEKAQSGLERELRTLSRMLWIEPGGGSLLTHIDLIARTSKVHIETFYAAPVDGGSGSLRYWKCDPKAPFQPLLVFLRKMSTSERIIHIRSLTMSPASAPNRSPRRLRLSLYLAAPTTGDDVR